MINNVTWFSNVRLLSSYSSNSILATYLYTGETTFTNTFKWKLLNKEHFQVVIVFLGTENILLQENYIYDKLYTGHSKLRALKYGILIFYFDHFYRKFKIIVEYAIKKFHY